MGEDNYNCIAANKCDHHKTACTDTDSGAVCINYGACEFCNNENTDECKSCKYYGVEHERTCF